MASRMRPAPVVLQRKGPAGVPAESPTSSTGKHLPTPGRAETGAGARFQSSPGVVSKEQAQRQKRLESLLSLPERVVRVGLEEYFHLL